MVPLKIILPETNQTEKQLDNTLPQLQSRLDLQLLRKQHY